MEIKKRKLFLAINALLIAGVWDRWCDINFIINVKSFRVLLTVWYERGISVISEAERVVMLASSLSVSRVYE